MRLSMKTKRTITNRRMGFCRCDIGIPRLHKMFKIVPCEQLQLLSVCSPYKYDNLDRQIAVTDSNGLRNETVYNDLGQVAETRVIGNGQTKTTRYEYDSFGNVIKTTFPDGTFITAEYNDESQKISEMNQLGQTRRFEYSETGQLTAVILPGNLRYEYAYDAQGNQTLIRDPNGHETRFTYDENGNQLTRTLPLGFGIDGIFGTADDEAAKNTDGSLDFTEYFEYDNIGRTIKAISFEGVITTYSYDDYGRLAKQDYYSTESNFNSGLKADSWTYKYDAFGRKIQVNQNGCITNTTYTSEGYVASITTPEGTVSYTYDDFGRQLSVSDGTNTTSYSYDNVGRLATVTSQSGTTTYSYDVFGNLAKAVTDTGTGKLTTTYEYDIMNRLTRLTNISDANNNGVMDTGEGISQFDYTLNSLGNKTHATETFWFDNNEDGVKDANVNSVDWTYDSQNRLIQEVFDHYNDEFDQTLDWTYDDVGNRLSQTKDKGNDSVIDEVTSCLYDANDRLIDELFDGQNDGSFEKISHYGYDKTQQTAKTVNENGVITSDTTFEYNSLGQMSVVKITKYTDGIANSIERTTYNYGFDGIRVSALHEIDNNADGFYDTATLTEYLNDPNNHTGYSQVLKTTEYTIDGETRTITKEIYYTIGLDQITQSVTNYIDGIAQNTKHYYFTYDGHGSTRVLLDATTAIMQLYSFDAYGNALGFNSANTLTEYLYSGEQFDSKIGQQYLRARYYDHATGRFNSLDSFFGNLNDPQSLHKYLYTYADPVNGIDPSGNFCGLAGMLCSFSINMGNQASKNSGDISTGANAIRLLRTLNNAYKMWEKIGAFYGRMKDLINLLSFDVSDLMELVKLTSNIENEIGQKINNVYTSKVGISAHINLPNTMCDKILTKMRAKAGVKNNTVQEIIGLLASWFAFTTLEFKTTVFTYDVTGLDGLLRAPMYENMFVVLEAKGGSSTLGRVNDPSNKGKKTRQMYDKWIESRLVKLRDFNVKQSNDKIDLSNAINNSSPMFAMIVKADLRPNKYKFHIGLKMYPGISETTNKWGKYFDYNPK